MMEETQPDSKQGANLSWDDFLSVLFSATQHYLELRAIPSRKRLFTRFDNRQAIDRFIKENIDQNLFFGVCTRVGEKGTKEAVKEVPVLWMDLDIKDLKGGKVEADKILNEIKSIIPPSIIIHSGGGYHIYWLLKEPEEARLEIESILKGLAKRFKGDMGSAELARVLRIPGTFNYKYDPSKEVEIIKLDTNVRYSLADFDVFKTEKTGLEYKERFDTQKALAGVPEGQRDETLFKLACKFRDADIPQDIAENLILHAAGNCNPPFPKSEAVAKVTNAYARYQAGHTKETKQTSIIVRTIDIEPEEQEGSLILSPAPFPEAAWHGAFKQWRDIMTPCTEAPLEFLWGAFLITAGLLLGRNIWKESPRPIYPNFYGLLLGQTGDSRKSTVLWLAMELIKHIGDDIEILTGIVSTEGLFERLAKKDGTRALGYADEFRSLLSVAKRKGTQDILPKLNSLYSCPEKEGIDRREKSTSVVKPFLSMITATPQEYVEDLLGNLEVVGGTLNRFLIISGEEQPPKADVKPPSKEDWKSIAAPLRKIRDRYTSNPRGMEWEVKAKALWTDFYVEWRSERKTWTPKAANLTARTFEHILKIALVYSALAEEERISPKSLAIAIAVGGWLENSVLRLFGDVGLDQFSKAEKIILEFIKPKNWTYVRDLQQAISKKGINSKLFRDALKTLEMNGHIELNHEEVASGRKRPVTRYIHGNREHQKQENTRGQVLGVPTSIQEGA